MVEADIEYLEKCLKEEAQTYNSKQLAEKLDKERGIKVSTNTIRRGLKKKG
ncbi:transposase [Nodularia spumigena CCY9414]|nr:transposase [Nodularia spumigena CCY9414]